MKMKPLFKKIVSIIIIVFLMTEFILADPLNVSATSGSWTGGTVDTGFHLKVTWSESAQDTITNTSALNPGTK